MKLTSKKNLELIYEKIEEKQSSNKNNNKLTLLEKEMKEIESSINNLLSAIEKGIITDSTKDRINELETMKKTVSSEIEIEKSKLNKLITKEDITTYIRKALKESSNYIVKFLIEKIVYFNEKIKIYYKVTNKETPDENRQAFLFCNTKYETVIIYNNRPKSKYVTYETKLYTKI